MKPSLIILALFILQCTHVTYSQSSDAVASTQPQQTSNVPVVTSAAVAETSSAAVAETSSAPAITTTATEAPKTTADATVAPATTATTNAAISTTANATTTSATANATTTSATATSDTTTAAAPTTDAADPTTSSSDTPTESKKEPPKKSTIVVTSNGVAVPTVITPSDSAQETESGVANKQGDDDSGSSKTATIAGSVVGGLVGIALIAGLLTWMNRRGGCTSRTHRRDVQEDFNNDNDYKMTENNISLGASGAAMQPSDNLPPSSPFQHARRFVPPTSTPTGYINLQDEEYGYHQNAAVGGAAGYQAQQYQAYNAGGVYNDGSHPDYSQDYQHSNEYAAHDYSADGSATGSNHGGYQQQAFYSNVTSPTVANSVQQLKPDQVEQKPNVA